MALTHLEAMHKLVEVTEENARLRDRIRELEALLTVRPSSSHGLEKYMNPDANTGRRGNRPGSDTGALSLHRAGFETDTEENPVQVNYEVDHR
jgi:hypothetical protein